MILIRVGITAGITILITTPIILIIMLGSGGAAGAIYIAVLAATFNRDLAIFAK